LILFLLAILVSLDGGELTLWPGWGETVINNHTMTAANVATLHFDYSNSSGSFLPAFSNSSTGKINIKDSGTLGLDAPVVLDNDGAIHVARFSSRL
jgi:hypothetical protein